MKRKPLFFFLAVLILAGAAILLSLILSTYGLSVTRYSIASPKLRDPLRIVHLSDLHNSVFGPHNARLVRKIAAQEPDLILITGDLLNANEERTDIATELITQLATISPVYVSFGNHERAYEKNYATNLRAVYTEAGATVLEYDWEDLCVNGQMIRLGGLYGYCLPADLLETREARTAECLYLEQLQDTDAYNILLCHLPFCWIVTNSLDTWEEDLVLCGHVHGGQVRFPWIGGLWAPDQGWFPGRECGLYWSKDGTKVMALSRGLGNTDRYPRFNNIPEILVLDLIPN